MHPRGASQDQSWAPANSAVQFRAQTTSIDVSPVTMSPSPLYVKLRSLAQIHAIPNDVEQLLSIRYPDAIHAWGHTHLVSRHSTLADRMDNTAFLAHLKSTGPYLDPARGGAEVHSITVDEYERRAVVHMSYFLVPAGSEEKVEQDLIWILKFTEGEDVEQVQIKESVEFIDATASARVGSVIRSVHGQLTDDVRGGITLQEGKL